MLEFILPIPPIAPPALAEFYPGMATLSSAEYLSFAE
jgi:hypothetical protein